MAASNWSQYLNFGPRIADRLDRQMVQHIGWNVDPEDLIHIPEHWRLYPSPDKSLHLLLGMIYIFLCIAAFIGNGLVLWIFSTAKSLRTASNMFVVNLAFCDLIIFLMMPIFVYNSFGQGFSAGWLACQIYAMIGSFSGIGAGMTNACIAYDRYMTITRPFDGKMSRTKAIVMILFVWMYATPWAILPMLEIWGRFIPEGFLTACSFDYLTTSFDNKLFVGSIFTMSYVIPLSFIMYFYSQIVSKVFTHEKTLRDQAKKMNVDSLRANQQQKSETAELRIAKAALTVSFMFVMSWTPYAALVLTGVFGDQSLVTPGVSMIPALTCKLVSCIDPYIYAISHPKYRTILERFRSCALSLNKSLEQNSSESLKDNAHEQNLSESPKDNAHEQNLSESLKDNARVQDLSESLKDNVHQQKSGESLGNNAHEQNLSESLKDKHMGKI